MTTLAHVQGLLHDDAPDTRCQERLEGQASSPFGQGDHDVIRADGFDDLGQLVERAEPRSLCVKTLFVRLVVDDTDHEWLNRLADLSSSISLEASGPPPRIRTREKASRLWRILCRSLVRTTTPTISSSHIAIWRATGQEPPVVRFMTSDSAIVREISNGARSHDRATLAMVCVPWEDRRRAPLPVGPLDG